jgi:hypothetical protein
MSIIEEHPIAWWWNPDVDPQTLGTMLDNNKGRLISASPFFANGQLRLAAVWVSNTGNQNKAWWWNPNVDGPTLGHMLEDNKGRLVSLCPYVVNGTLRLAAVWVSNTGVDNQAWWWNPDVDGETLGTMLNNNQGRLVCLNTYTIGNSRRHSAVWVSNTGVHNKAWWWNPDVDGETLGTMLNNNQGRLVSLDPFITNGKIRYAAVWIQNLGQQGRAWWWYPSIDAEKLGQKFDLFCSYAVDLKSYVAGGQRRLACVLYAYPSDPNPSDAKLVQVTGSATVKQLSNNIAPLDQTDTVTVGVQNLTSSTTKITEAEMLVSQSGGWVDYKIPLYGRKGFFQGKTQELTPGQSYSTSGDIGSGLCTTHCVIRLEAEQGQQKQYTHTSIPIVRANFVPPPAFAIPEPVYIGAWNRPAEIVPMWVGKLTKWLTVGGQIINGSGSPARIGDWHIVLEIDGKVYLDQPLPMNFQRMNMNNQLESVPTQSGVPILADFLSYFVHGFEVGGVPNAFSTGTLRLIGNYKVGNRCGAAVCESPVVLTQPVTLKSPVSGAWWWGNSPNHQGFDAHAWPHQRFSVDLLVHDADGNTFSGDENTNTSFYCYGKPVVAMADGTVIKSHDTEDENFGMTENKNKKDINYVLIEHAPGKISGYYHLRKGKNVAHVRDEVKAGDKLGEVGNSGGTSELHLHIGYVSVDETGRGRLRPMQFSDLQTMGGTAVVGVPGTEEYKTAGTAGKVVAATVDLKATKVMQEKRELSTGPEICRLV